VAVQCELPVAAAVSISPPTLVSRAGAASVRAALPVAAARLSAAFVYQSTDPRLIILTESHWHWQWPSTQVANSGCRPVNALAESARGASHLSFSGRHCQVEVNQPSQFQRPAFRVSSHLSFSGRHSPATSASEVGIHQPSQVGIAAVSVSEVRSGQVYSASPAIQGSARHRQPLADVSVSERPRSSSYLPSAGAGARQRGCD
jgi:hypothetical protein